MKNRCTPFKLICIFGLITIAFCQASGLHAQSKSLPYKCGWDNAAEKAGWTLYQLKSTKYFGWGIGSYLGHDYPVGNPGTDTVEDWVVSPPLNVTGKSEISFSTNVYVIAGIQPTDYFGVWYSKTSPDPKKGNFKELANLTSFASKAFDYWHDTAGIILNDSGSTVYIAFKYGETDNWFTIKVDTLEVQGVHTSGIESQNKISKTEINIYPNPSHGSFSFKLPVSMVSENASIEIYDLAGRQLLHKETKCQVDNDIDTQMLSPGMYQCRVSAKGGEVHVEKLIVE